MAKAKLMAAISGAVALAFSAGAAWEPGEPVTTYWFGPGCPGTNKYALAMTDAWAKQLKEGGFNTVWASTPEELDIAAKYGLRAIYSVDPRTEWARIKLDDPEQKAKLAERINRVKNHPALYIYEVNGGTYDASGSRSSRYRQRVHTLKSRNWSDTQTRHSRLISFLPRDAPT